jgi:RNA polymerase sigma factor (sigma-70 family)
MATMRNAQRLGGLSVAGCTATINDAPTEMATETPRMTDSELLIRYADSGSPQAFTELVERHTSKVYGACLRILGDPHAAEDATQAAFLVLSRKGATLRRDIVLADWLFWTAKHCAQNLKRGMKRRARHEQEAAMRREKAASSESSWSDVRPHLDLALAALPARQREAAVLHYFYGLSQNEIARQTNSPQTTVSRRLSAALDKLRRKLSATGLSLSATTLAGFLAEKTIVEAPAGLAASISAACLSGGAASAAAVTVANAVVKAVRFAQLKALGAVLGVAVIVGSGVGAVSHFVPPNSSPSSALADDPSIIASLEALQAGHALRLPPARVLGVDKLKLSAALRKRLENGPGYRYKCNRMLYAPERRSGLYCGAATMFITNDAWEFSLGANAWRPVSAPDGGDHREIGLAGARIRMGRDVARNRKLITDWHINDLEFANGYLRTRRNGGPVVPSHTWDGVSYDPIGGRLYWIMTAGHHPPTGEHLKQTGRKQDAAARKGTTMWSLDSRSGNWRPEFGNAPRPRTHGMGGTLVYDSRRHRLVWYVAARNVRPHDYQMWAYDLGIRTWKDLKPNAGAELQELEKAGSVPPAALQAAYSPKLDRIVAVNGTRTWVYDCAANSWQPAASHAPNHARDQDTVFAREAGSDTFLLADPEGKRLAAYDASSDRWQEITIRGDALPAKKCTGYFDPRLRVLVLYDGSTRAWVYRHTK